MVYRLQLTYNEIMDIFDVKYIAGPTSGYTLPPGVYEISDNNFMLKSFLPGKIKVNNTIDDIRLKSNLTTNKTIKFTKKFFFLHNNSFTQSNSGPLGDIAGFVQLIPGNYRSDKPINITGSDEIHLKCDCIQGSIVNSIRQSILYSFALSSPPGHKIYKQPRINLFEKITKSALSHITFYLEDDNHKAVNFNRETIGFTCQLITV